MSKCYKILTIDGGGIKGLYSAYILKHIEERFGKITDHFDMICGTSTGGIIALGLASGNSADTIVDFYEKKGPLIFPHFSKFARFKAFIRQLICKGKYDNHELKKHLEDLLGDRTLGESQNCLVIPSVRLTGGMTRTFKYPHKEGNFYKDKNIKMVDAALATSAAPTYFPVVEISDDLHTDGGLWANNPSLCGMVEAIDYFVGEGKEYDSFGILSISSVATPKMWNVSTKKRKSFWDWKTKLLPAIMDSQSYYTDFVMKRLAPKLNGKYFRIPNPEISAEQESCIELDLANETAIKTLRMLGNNTGADYTTKQEYREIIEEFFKEKKTYVTEVHNEG